MDSGMLLLIISEIRKNQSISKCKKYCTLDSSNKKDGMFQKQANKQINVPINYTQLKSRQTYFWYTKNNYMLIETS